MLGQATPENSDREALFGEAFRFAARSLETAESTPNVSLGEYIREAWHVVEPATEYQHNWHIDAIAEHLIAVTDRDIRNLLINIPPGHAKSLIVAVFWPTWEWTFKPHTRWVFASYAQDLSTRDSLRCRRVIQSDWYQQNWGHVFKLADDQNRKTKFENNKTGLRDSISVDASTTGLRGDTIVIDDPHNVKKADSDADRLAKLSWFNESWQSRLNDPRTGAKVMIMQRVHEADLSARAIELGWTHLCLPSEFEQERACVTVPVGGREEPWTDPRTEEGELLWPDRYGEQELSDLKRPLGDYAYAGQYQQRPAPAEGGILKKKWWRYWQPAGADLPPVIVQLPGRKFVEIKPVERPSLGQTLHSWDMTFKETKSGSYVVGQVWQKDGARRFLIDQVRDRWDFSETSRQVVALHEKYPNATKLVEDKANGPAIMSSLKRKVPKMIAIEPDGTKEERASAVTDEIEAGDVFLPHPDMPGYEWVKGFIAECVAFPNGANDDQVDAASQALRRMQDDYEAAAAPIMTGQHNNPYKMG
ncbi:MAG: phage terminase large subunit [Solirubrobacterales bacterium]